MVTSAFRPEVEIRPFRACAMHPAIIIGTVRSLWTQLWGRYHVPQNAFLVYFNVVCCTMLTSVIFLPRLKATSLPVALSVAVITIHVGTIEQLPFLRQMIWVLSLPQEGVGTCLWPQWTGRVDSLHQQLQPKYNSKLSQTPSLHCSLMSNR